MDGEHDTTPLATLDTRAPTLRQILKQVLRVAQYTADDLARLRREVAGLHAAVDRLTGSAERPGWSTRVRKE